LSPGRAWQGKPMSTDRYYSSNGKRLGPVSETELRNLAATGRITASDLVWRTGQPSWIPAASVPGLLPGPPPLPTRGHPQRTKTGKTKWVVLGVIGGVILLVFVSLQSMMNNHNRRRQGAIDHHRNEAQRSMERVDGMFNELESNRRQGNQLRSGHEAGTRPNGH
jgi:hypothetical protein